MLRGRRRCLLDAGAILRFTGELQGPPGVQRQAHRVHTGAATATSSPIVPMQSDDFIIELLDRAELLEQRHGAWMRQLDGPLESK